MKTDRVELWQCRHGVDLKQVALHMCDECVMAPAMRGENLIAVMAAMLHAHIDGLRSTLEADTWSGNITDAPVPALPRDKVRELVESAFMMMIVTSTNAASYDAPPCPVEFPLVRAGRILGGERNDDRVVADVLSQVTEAAKVAQKWRDDVKTWAKDCVGDAF